MCSPVYTTLRFLSRDYVSRRFLGHNVSDVELKWCLMTYDVLAEFLYDIDFCVCVFVCVFSCLFVCVYRERRSVLSCEASLLFLIRPFCRFFL